MYFKTLCAVLLAASPALADGHDPHMASVGGVSVLHAWTNAAPAGEAALIFMEIENHAATPMHLHGGTALGQALDLVGFRYGAEGAEWHRLPGLTISPGTVLELAPGVLALRLVRLPEPLAEGATLEVELRLGDHHLDVAAEVGAAGATAHSHAGHSH